MSPSQTWHACTSCLVVCQMAWKRCASVWAPTWGSKAKLWCPKRERARTLSTISRYAGWTTQLYMLLECGWFVYISVQVSVCWVWMCICMSDTQEQVDRNWSSQVLHVKRLAWFLIEISNGNRNDQPWPLNCKLNCGQWCWGSGGSKG